MINNIFQKDLDYFLEKLEEKHICMYYKITKSELFEYIKSYLNIHEIMNELEFGNLLKIIIKQLGDSHTRIVIPDEGQLPIKLNFIGNKLYVGKSEKEKYNNQEIISINNISVEKIIGELEKYTCYETKGWLDHRIEIDLTNTKRILGFLPSKEIIKVEYYLDNQESILFDINQRYDISFLKENNNFTLYKKGKSLVFVYKSCIEPEPNLMNSKVNEIKNILEMDKIEKIIIDLRGNLGGSSRIINPLIDFLKTANLKVIVLVDHSCFSSTLFAINQLKQIGSIFIGEEIGSPINHFGELENFVLPNTKIKIYFSTKYFYIDNNQFLTQVITQKDFLSLESEKIKPNYFYPDIYVQRNIDDNKKGIDTTLKIALDYKNN